jgi:hypothetical protein
MAEERTCKAVKEQGEPCRAAPLQGGDYCLMHDPEHAEEMAQARRLGGLRRRKEQAVQGAFDVEGLEDVEQIRRLLMIAAVDTLSQDSTIARSRTLVLIAQAAAKLRDAGEVAEQMRELAAVLTPRRQLLGRGRRRG